MKKMPSDLKVFVKQIISSSDLSVLTKRKVRDAYSKHVGRKLEESEKDRVNKLVYKFLDELNQSNSFSENNTSLNTSVEASFAIDNKENDSKSENVGLKSPTKCLKEENKKLKLQDANYKSPKKLNDKSLNTEISPKKKLKQAEFKRSSLHGENEINISSEGKKKSDNVEACTKQNSNSSPQGAKCLSATDVLSAVLDDGDDAIEIEESENEEECSESEEEKPRESPKESLNHYKVETNSDDEKDWTPFPDESTPKKRKDKLGKEKKRKRVIESDSEDGSNESEKIGSDSDHKTSPQKKEKKKNFGFKSKSTTSCKRKRMKGDSGRVEKKRKVIQVSDSDSDEEVEPLQKKGQSKQNTPNKSNNKQIDAKNGTKKEFKTRKNSFNLRESESESNSDNESVQSRSKDTSIINKPQIHTKKEVKNGQDLSDENSNQEDSKSDSDNEGEEETKSRNKGKKRKMSFECEVESSLNSADESDNSFSGSEYNRPNKKKKRKLSSKSEQKKGKDSGKQQQKSIRKEKIKQKNERQKVEPESSSEDEILSNISKRKTSTDNISSDDKQISKSEEGRSPVKSPGKGTCGKSELNEEMSTDSSDEESPLVNLKKSCSDSSSNHGNNNKTSKRKQETHKKKSITTEDTESSSEEESKSANKSRKKNSKTSKEDSGSEEEGEFVKKLKALCRQCGRPIRNSIELKGLKTNSTKVKKLKEILKDLGMEGRPSQDKVKEVLLKKEAAELDSDNIISNERVIGQRSARSKYSQKPKPSVNHVSPVKFNRIKDLIDSEESD